MKTFDEWWRENQPVDLGDFCLESLVERAWDASKRLAEWDLAPEWWKQKHPERKPEGHTRDDA